MKLLFKNLGGGILQSATPTDLHYLSKIAVGDTVWAEIKRPRSVQQNRFMHSLCKQAFLNQRREYFESGDHVRAFAFCVVGHKDVIAYDVPATATPEEFQELERFVSTAVRQLLARGDYVFVRRTATGLAIDIPRSWSFNELGAERAGEITDEVAAWITSPEGPCPGTSIDDLFLMADSQ